MTQDTQYFAVSDPREFDGNPYEVADRAAGQVAGLIKVTLGAAAGGNLMARNAYLERQCVNKETLTATEWESSPEGIKWRELMDKLTELQPIAQALQRAAAYDPKAPL